MDMQICPEGVRVAEEGYHVRTVQSGGTVPMILLVLVLVGSTAGRAQEPRTLKSPVGPAGHLMVTPADLKWAGGPPALPPGATMAVIEGSLQSPGPFVVRLRFPTNYKIRPHWHPIAVYVTVISGTFNMGMGDELDQTKGKALPAGSITTMPALIHHFGWASEETIIQLHGVGPWDIKYANRADDQRKK